MFALNFGTLEWKRRKKKKETEKEKEEGAGIFLGFRRKRGVWLFIRDCRCEARRNVSF